MDLPTGEVVADRYRVVDRLGRGGMAVVYRAHDEVLDRRVALKVLSGHLLDDDRSVDRFGREARSAAGLNHPNVVSVHDAASDGDVHFLVMELVDGQSLSDHLRADGPLSVDESLSIADRVAAALGAAHQRGLVHRDVKPSNILLTSAGDVKVADFGIARAVASEATQTAVVMGSVPYVAPEQLDGRAGADPRSDLYALGCVLFECLTGRPPFAADTSAAVLGQHLHAPAPSVHDHRPDAGGPVDALVASLLAKDPDHRPPSADDLRTRIARVRAGEDPGGGGTGGGAGPGDAAAGAVGAAAAGGAGLWAARAGGDAGATDPTEVVDPRFAPTEAVDPAGSTRRLSSSESGHTSRLDETPSPPTSPSRGSGGDGMDLPPGSGSGRSRGRAWLVGLLVLLLAVIAWALVDRGDDPAIAPTTPPDTTEAPAETPDEATEAPTQDATEAPAQEPTTPATTAPAEPSAAPTTAPEPSPTAPAEPSPTPPSTTSTPTTPPTATATATATEQAIVDLRQDLVDGVDTGQLDAKAADKLGEGVSKVAEILAGDGDDRLDKARAEIDKVREELAKQVEQGANPGIANQFGQGLDELEATLA